MHAFTWSRAFLLSGVFGSLAGTLFTKYLKCFKKKKLCVFVLCFNVLISQINFKK